MLHESELLKSHVANIQHFLSCSSVDSQLIILSVYTKSVTNAE